MENSEQNISSSSTVPVQKPLIHDFRLGSPYFPGTICVFLHGVRAPVIDKEEIAQALKDYADVDEIDIEDLSNIGTNKVWFLRLTIEARVKLYGKLHRFSFTIKDGSVKFILKHLEKMYLVGSLHGAPAHFTHNEVEKVIRCFPTLSSAIAVRPLGGGSWGVLFLPKKANYVPHFVDIYYEENEYQTVVLTLKGRVTTSCFCEGYDFRACRIMLSDRANRIRRRIHGHKLCVCCTREE